MSKFESMCDAIKSDGGPAIAGIGMIGLIVGGYYFSKRGYKVDVRKGDHSITIAPAQHKSEQNNGSKEIAE